MTLAADHHWQRLRFLFAEASKLSRSEEESFLDRECGPDGELRQEVEALLRRRREPSDPVDEAVKEAAHSLTAAYSRARLEPGQELGKYRILHLLGEGGMGAVYAARDIELGRVVALKLLAGWKAREPASLEQFRREARALAALNHPSIVTIYDLEHEDDVDLLVMELVEGDSLDRIFPEDGLALEEFFATAIPLVDAVAAAHDRGVIHRDLKPANIMIADGHKVKVLDFGLATLGGDEPTAARRSENAGQAPRMVMGTIPYMSPEQLAGNAAGARSDVFSLGVLLWEMGTGSRPFQRRSLLRTGDSLPALSESGPNAHVSNADLPPQLAAIFARCLEDDPDRRFEDAGALAQALASVAREMNGAPDPVTASGRSSSSSWWRSWLAKGSLPRWVLATAIALPIMIGLTALEQTAPTPRENHAFRTVLVLPFVDVSKHETREYLADGMTELLTEDLSRIKGLRVVSHGWAMELGSLDPEALRDRGIDAVVRGSVGASGDLLDVSVRVVHLDAGGKTWNATVDGKLGELLGVRKRVSRTLVREVGAPADRRDPSLALQSGESAVSSRAMEAYLRGLEARRRREYLRAVSHFEEAVAAEPDFASAHLAIAEVLQMRMATGWLSASEWRDRCREELSRVLELAPELADAHLTLGYLSLKTDWDWAMAEQAFQRAIELSPGLAPAHQGLAELMIIAGRTDEGLEIARRAWERKPVSPVFDTTAPHQLFLARRFDEAVSEIRKQPDTEDPGAHWLMTVIAQARGDLEGAVWFDLAFRRSVGAPRELVDELEASLESGTPRDYWRAISRQYPRDPTGHEHAAEIARAYVNLGDVDRAIGWLEKAFELRQARMRALAVDPSWDPLRGDPRFTRLVQRLALPAARTVQDDDPVSLVPAGS